LISGFISAMSSMYGEFTGDGTQESVESLKYQSMTLNGFTGNYIVGILISEGNIKTSFNLNDFINSFESKYEDVLKDWRGLIKIFDRNWIVKQIFDSLGYYDNLPFVVSSQKPEKKQYRKVVDFVRIISEGHGMFLIRKVLMGLKKFLNMSEAHTLDVLMMMKNEGVISHVPVEYIIESTAESSVLFETLSSGVIVEDTIDDASDYTDELIDKKETEDIESNELQKTDGISAGVPKGNITVTEDGKYSFEKVVSLDDIMRNSGDWWLRDIVSEAVTLELGKQVVVSNPQYTPIGYDSEKGTIRIRVTFSDANQ
ncbi:MAG: hypothetical protein KAR33_12890, partial [Candidatus Thorarchaeota archaeon]|nr:hypothetical protein [Candidatus Thorarchaeota archaeon]